MQIDTKSNTASTRRFCYSSGIVSISTHQHLCIHSTTFWHRHYTVCNGVASSLGTTDYLTVGSLGPTPCALRPLTSLPSLRLPYPSTSASSLFYLVASGVSTRAGLEVPTARGKHRPSLFVATPATSASQPSTVLTFQRFAEEVVRMRTNMCAPLLLPPSRHPTPQGPPTRAA